MGKLISFRRKQVSSSDQVSGSTESASRSKIPQEWIDQIFLEAREQWGYWPDTDGSDPMNGQESKD